MDLEVGDMVYLWLHHRYNIPEMRNRKLSNQWMGLFKILKKYGKLAFELDLSKWWRIHPMISITHLEPCSKDEDPYGRPQPDHLSLVLVEGDTKEWQSFKIDKIVNK